MAKMTAAITRAPSPAIHRCELAFRVRQEIDIGEAISQHRQYEDCLRGLGVRVISLAAEPDLPDAVFVEDPAIVLDEVAIVTRMGTPSRRPEAESLAAALARFRPVHWIESPATLEGGDVLRVGSKLWVGRSRRTNPQGIRQLRELVEPFGYSVEPVEVHGSMHLKTACGWLGEGRLLANRGWIDTSTFGRYEIWDVPPEEPFGANVLLVNGIVLVSASAPRTGRMLEARGLRVRMTEIGELEKAEAGLTCMSVLFTIPD